MTRDRKALRCEWNGVTFSLIDTGGVDLAADDSLSREVQRQAKEANKTASPASPGQPAPASPEKEAAAPDQSAATTPNGADANR